MADAERICPVCLETATVTRNLGLRCPKHGPLREWAVRLDGHVLYAPSGTRAARMLYADSARAHA
jgi:hypothetical protein